MAKLSSDLTEQQQIQLNKLLAKKKAADRAQEEYKQARAKDNEEEHLTSKWFEICQFYEIESEEDQARLFEHICSEQQKNFYGRKMSY